MAFKQRYSKPSPSNMYYRRNAKYGRGGIIGGLSKAIVGANSMRGNTLPNCVGYAFGRVHELMGKLPAFSASTANKWWGENPYNSRGQKPIPGAVACWYGGWKNSGHVAIVEHVDKKTGVITITESNWSTVPSMYFRRYKVKPPYNISGLSGFTGFVYHPGCGESSEDWEDGGGSGSEDPGVGPGGPGANLGEADNDNFLLLHGNYYY